VDENTKASPESARRAWAAALLLQRPALLTRFQSTYAHLMALPRNARRRLHRRAAVSLAGAALLLGLSASPLLVPRVHAATISVGGTCSLVDAIRSANADTSYGTCVAGSGADTITLSEDVLLTTSYAYYYGSDTGLPMVATILTIDGNGHTIERDGAAPDFRLLAVSSTGDLTVQDVTLSGGRSQYNGGALYNYQGTLTVLRSTVTNNYAAIIGGGGLYNNVGDADIIDSTFSFNSARAGGAIWSEAGTLDVSGSTFYGNTTFAYSGGAIYVDEYDTTTITNSTISGNSAVGNGGGVYSDEFSTTTITHSTIADNYAGGYGGGVYGYATSTTTLISSIVSGNSAGILGDEVARQYYGGTINANADNVFGHSGISNAAAFFYFYAGVSDVTATSDGTTPTALGGILETTLADNGGPTLTHDLVAGSPAIDLGSVVALATDQRGATRPFGATQDAGAVEYGAIAPDAVFASASTSGVTDDAVAFGPHDVLVWNEGSWSKWFDGSAAGLMPNGKAKHNINAVWVPDVDGSDAVMSFAQNARFVPGIVPKVDGMDLVWWDGSAFSLWFDGQDVGLTNLTDEKIDALHVLDGSLSPVGGGCANYLLISTQAAGSVPGVGGAIKFSGEDVLGFCQTNVGEATAGVWHKLLDGSDEGMPRNSTVNLSASEDGETLFITTRAAFDVDDATGGHSMIYRFDMTTGEFSGPEFVAANAGLHQVVDALNY